MSPGKVVNVLTRRLTWLRARTEASDVPRGFDLDEAAALARAIAVFQTVNGGESEEQAERRVKGEETARVRLAERATKCTCESCPVHGGQER